MNEGSCNFVQIAAKEKLGAPLLWELSTVSVLNDALLFLHVHLLPQHLASTPARKKRKHATCCCTEVFSQEAIKPKKALRYPTMYSGAAPHLKPDQFSFLSPFLNSKEHDDMINILPQAKQEEEERGLSFNFPKAQFEFKQRFSFYTTRILFCFIIIFIILKHQSAKNAKNHSRDQHYS